MPAGLMWSWHDLGTTVRPVESMSMGLPDTLALDVPASPIDLPGSPMVTANPSNMQQTADATPTQAPSHMPSLGWSNDHGVTIGTVESMPMGLSGTLPLAVSVSPIYLPGLPMATALPLRAPTRSNVQQAVDAAPTRAPSQMPRCGWQLSVQLPDVGAQTVRERLRQQFRKGLLNRATNGGTQVVLRAVALMWRGLDASTTCLDTAASGSSSTCDIAPSTEGRQHIDNQPAAVVLQVFLLYEGNGRLASSVKRSLRGSLTACGLTDEDRFVRTLMPAEFEEIRSQYLQPSIQTFVEWYGPQLALDEYLAERIRMSNLHAQVEGRVEGGAALPQSGVASTAALFSPAIAATATEAATEPVTEPVTMLSASAVGPAIAQIIETLKCSICLDVYDAPMMISGCGHTFCRECIKQHLQGRDEFNKKCPNCKMPARWRDCKPAHAVACVVQVAKRVM